MGNTHNIIFFNAQVVVEMVFSAFHLSPASRACAVENPAHRAHFISEKHGGVEGEGLLLCVLLLQSKLKIMATFKTRGRTEDVLSMEKSFQ